MTLYIVRHAVAVAKARWAGSDALRPLTPRGVVQAEELAAAMPSGVDVVLSSPTVRCVATVLPLAVGHGAEVRTRGDLSVGDPAGALALARDLLDGYGAAGGPSAVLCSHGEVIPALLVGLGVRGGGRADRCAKGSVWEVTGNGGSVTGRYRAPTPRRRSSGLALAV